MNFSAQNWHRFRHNFDCISPICMYGRGIDDSKHFLLHCNRLDLMRRGLFRPFTTNGLDIRELNSNALCNLLLFIIIIIIIIIIVI